MFWKRVSPIGIRLPLVAAVLPDPLHCTETNLLSREVALASLRDPLLTVFWECILGLQDWEERGRSALHWVPESEVFWWRVLTGWGWLIGRGGESEGRESCTGIPKPVGGGWGGVDPLPVHPGSSQYVQPSNQLTTVANHVVQPPAESAANFVARRHMSAPLKPETPTPKPNQFL